MTGFSETQSQHIYNFRLAPANPLQQNVIAPCLLIPSLKIISLILSEYPLHPSWRVHHICPGPLAESSASTSAWGTSKRSRCRTTAFVSLHRAVKASAGGGLYKQGKTKSGSNNGSHNPHRIRKKSALSFCFFIFFSEATRLTYSAMSFILLVASFDTFLQKSWKPSTFCREQSEGEVNRTNQKGKFNRKQINQAELSE